MLITLVVVLVVVLTLILIIFNLFRDFRFRREAELKVAISKYRTAISESEDLLANNAELPYSKTLVLMLRGRILRLLKLIAEHGDDPITLARIETEQQAINDINNNYKEDLKFESPRDDQSCIAKLRTIRKLKRLVTTEAARGIVGAAAGSHTKEIARLDLLSLKLNIANLVRNVIDLKRRRQNGTLLQLLPRGIAAINKASSTDPWLTQQLEFLKRTQIEIDTARKTPPKPKNAAATTEDKTKKQPDELDELFGDKKKW